MKVIILLEEKRVLSKEYSEKDISFKFKVPENIKSIEILFKYDPALISDKTLYIDSLSKAIDKYYSIYDKNIEKITTENFDCIKNLLTISLDCNGVFIGNRHRWDNNQRIKISTQNADLGFVSPSNIHGEWIITIHCHQIFIKDCNIDLKVVGEYA